MGSAVFIISAILIAYAQGGYIRSIPIMDQLPTVGETLRANYSKYYKLITSVFLHPMLNDRDVTIFAVPNRYMDKISKEEKEHIRIHRGFVYATVLFQTIFSSMVPSSAFRNGLFLLTGLHNKAFVNIKLFNGTKTMWIGGKKILKTDIDARRGIIHEIDGLLTPPVFTFGQVLKRKGNYQNFLTALSRAQLLLPTGYTIFAPNDSTFWKISEDERMSLLGNREANKELASMHIITQTIYTSMIDDKPLTISTIHRRLITLIKTKSGITLTVDNKDPKQTTPKITIIKADIPIENGVMHLIDNFVPPGLEHTTVWKKIRELNLTTFQRNIIETGFEPFLNYQGSVYTIFAPTEDAYNLENQVPNSRRHNDRITRFHILPGKILARTLRKFKEIQTMSGDMIMLRKYGQKSMAAKGLIVKPDIEVENGIIHVVDRVLEPRVDGIGYALAMLDNPSTSKFREAMQIAGLGPLINQRRSFPNIFFVPSDEAFMALPLQTREYLFNDRIMLRKLLRYHIVPGFFYSRLMVHKWVYLFSTRLRGGKLRVRSFADTSVPKLIIYNPLGRTAQTIVTDLGAISGTVNIIDHVLIPQGIKIPGLYTQVSNVLNNIAKRA